MTQELSSSKTVQKLKISSTMHKKCQNRQDESLELSSLLYVIQRNENNNTGQSTTWKLKPEGNTKEAGISSKPAKYTDLGAAVRDDI